MGGDFFFHVIENFVQFYKKKLLHNCRSSPARFVLNTIESITTQSQLLGVLGIHIGLPRVSCPLCYSILTQTLTRAKTTRLNAVPNKPRVMFEITHQQLFPPGYFWNTNRVTQAIFSLTNTFTYPFRSVHSPNPVGFSKLSLQSKLNSL